MTEILVFGLVLALASSFVLTLGHKWGVVTWLQVHAPCDLLWRLFGCDFCMSWWCSVALASVWCAVSGDWWLMVSPVLSARLSANMVTNTQRDDDKD